LLACIGERGDLVFGDTIAAIATPLGEGGIGIVRISGDRALKVLERVFRGKRERKWEECPSHTMYYGHVVDPQTGETVDEALVALMRAPHSYTTEDVVEFHCHGGIQAVRKTLAVVLSAGCRLAEPGEFTRRAFLNGRLDLAQAEAVIDVIRASTERGLSLAVQHLGGGLSNRVKGIREEILGLLAAIEAGVDFPDEVGEADATKIIEAVHDIAADLRMLDATAQAGKLYREGIRLVIAGKPNVGKSSLLNALLREKRAIVTDLPGTTRDVIEEVINIKGIPARIMDTAGIRETSDLVERLGVEKTRELLAEADLILLVVDRTTGLNSEDEHIRELVKGRRLLVVLNKMDAQPGKVTKEDVQEWAGGAPLVGVSALHQEGIGALENTIADLVLAGKVYGQDQTLVTRARHQDAIQRAARHLEEVLNGLVAGVAKDILTVDLYGALDALGEVTGETVGEDVLDRIFSDFCIGK